MSVLVEPWPLHVFTFLCRVPNRCVHQEQCLRVFVSGPGNAVSSGLALSLDVHMANKQRKHGDHPFPVFVWELSQTSSVFLSRNSIEASDFTSVSAMMPVWMANVCIRNIWRFPQQKPYTFLHQPSFKNKHIHIKEQIGQVLLLYFSIFNFSIEFLPEVLLCLMLLVCF